MLDDVASHRGAYHLVANRPGTGPSPGPGPIVVGVDRGDASRAALRFACDTATGLGNEVVAVHALPVSTEFLLDIPPMGLTSWRTNLTADLVEEWCAPLAEAGVPHRIFVVERPVVTALTGLAVHEGASRIVVGVNPRHGRRGALADHLGKVAGCPVVAVPTPVGPSQAAS